MNMENNFYIKIENGRCINHPVIQNNLEIFFPDHDFSVPPEGFAKFVRTPTPDIDEGYYLEGTYYGLSEQLSELYGTETYTDMFTIREITYEQKMKMVEEFKKMNPKQSDWIWDDETDSLIAPIPKPNDGKEYTWAFPGEASSGSKGSWVEKSEIDTVDPKDFEEMFLAMKELGLEISSNTDIEINIPKEVIEGMIINFKNNIIPK